MARKEQLIKLRQMLVKRRDALRKALAGDLSELNELNQGTGDVADFALDIAHEEISSQLAEAESRELVQIDNALDRMSSGTYGRCEGCNRPIPTARLNALPYATLCIECQREEEGVGGMRAGARFDYGSLPDSDENGPELSINDIELDVP